MTPAERRADMNEGGGLMTDIDNLPIEELRAALAVEVMGWERRQAPIELGGRAEWYDKTDDGFVAVDAWRPDEKWGQHIGLFVRVHELGIETRGEWSRDGARWAVRSGDHLYPCVRQDGQDYMLTFCFAALKAVRAGRVTA